MFAGTTKRAWPVVLLLGVSLLLVLFLAGQAFYALRTQHEVTRDVVRDYAALAGDEFARRAVVEIGYRGIYPLVLALNRIAADPENIDEALDALPASEERDVVANLDLVGALFQVDPEPGGNYEGPYDDELIAGVAKEFVSDPEQPFSFWRGALDGQPSLLVYLPVPGDSGRFLGFAVDQQAFKERFGRVFEAGPLLPAALTDRNAFDNDWLYLNVTGPDGDNTLVHGERYQADLRVERGLGGYYEGLLEGYNVEVALDPDAAAQLVIGGLPESRLPTIGVLLLLTIGLIGFAMTLVRREAAFASARADFIARVSHELRTPLAQIRLFAETLRHKRFSSDADQQRSLEIIDREARRLSHLVDNVLEFSKSERGRIDLHRVALDLAALTEDAVASYAPPPSVNIEALTEATVPVDADPDALRQVVLNLLDNAVKYGPQQQTVRVSVDRNEHKARLSVEDEGPGIPAHERDRIFVPYYRMRREDNENTTGTGIGLAVVKELVNRHNGVVSVEPCDSGGTRFVVEMPLSDTP